jgi:hypothetical protein
LFLYSGPRFPSALAILAGVSYGVAGAAAQTLPLLPQATVETTLVAGAGRSLTVAAGGDVQAALDQAEPGDTVLLQAGATFTGAFRLPNKAGAGWITVRTSAADSQLPAPGQRITPAHAALLPKLVTSGAWPALATTPGAHHYRFIGVEFAIAPGVATNYGIVTLGSGAETALSELPHHIVLDRVYVHGNATGNVRRGVALNSAASAVIDSYVSAIHEVGADTQAIAVWNSPGPLKIVNSYLEAAGENVLIGGADPRITGLVPSDIEFRRNHLFKPLQWRLGDASYAGTQWTVKNLLELKNAQRVLIEGNRLEYHWPHAQNGFAILFTVRNQEGTAPWSVVQDVTFVSNVVQHVSAGISVLGRDDIRPSQPTRRIRIANNLFVDVGGSWGGNGRLLQVLDGPSDVVVEHNTSLQTGEYLVGSGTPASGFVFRNNLVAAGGYGLGGDGTYGSPMATLTTYFPGFVFAGNALVGATSTAYPSGNYLVPSFDAVGFVSATSGDYRLAASSPYKGAGTDGRDVGVDFAQLGSALAGGGSGDGGGGGGATDTTAPSVSLVTPGDHTTVAGALTIGAQAADDTAVASVRFLVDGAQVGPESTAAPFTATWNTASVSDGEHAIHAEARDAAGNVASSQTIAVHVANTAVAPPPAQAITWTRLVKVSVAGSALEKKAGCSGCPDAGASSVESIASGSGYLEFVVPVTTAQQVVGLASGDTGTAENDAAFALKFWPGGTMDVRLKGAYQAEGRFAAGDVFRITVVNASLVTFSKNGQVFHESNRQVTYPLVADVSMSTRGARIASAALVGTGSAVPGAAPVVWTSLFNVETAAGGLRKVAGCDGCQDAGAVSSQVITSGSGYVEFTIAETAGQKVVGLSAGNSGTSEADVDFGIKLWPGGNADVRENGAYVNAETTYAQGDVFRVSVAAGKVTYSKNGQEFYRSARTPSASLLVDTSFSSAGAQIADVKIEGAN